MRCQKTYEADKNGWNSNFLFAQTDYNNFRDSIFDGCNDIKAELIVKLIPFDYSISIDEFMASFKNTLKNYLQLFPDYMDASLNDDSQNSSPSKSNLPKVANNSPPPKINKIAPMTQNVPQVNVVQPSQSGVSNAAKSLALLKKRIKKLKKFKRFLR